MIRDGCDHVELVFHAVWDLRRELPEYRPNGLEQLLLANCVGCQSTLCVGYEYLVRDDCTPLRYVKKPIYRRDYKEERT